MNILVIKNPYRSQPHGGGEIHTMEVMNHLRGRGHKIYFAGTCRYLLEMAEANGFPISRTKWAGQEAVSEEALLKFFFNKRKIKKNWEKFLERVKETRKIDLVYILSWNEKFLIPPIADKLEMKVVFVEHVLLGKFIKANPWRNSYIRNSNRATTIAVSEAVKKSVEECGVDSRRIRVIRNGIESDFISSPPDRSGRNGLRIGTVSRLCRQKGLDYLIKAIAVLKVTWPDIQLEIVGTGDDKNRLRRLVKTLSLEDNVHFQGGKERSELEDFLKEIDIFAYTPLYGEAFGLALAEAGLAGLPSVVTDIGGVPEVVRDRETGIVVPPADVEQLARGIGYLIENDDKREQMGLTARQRIKENFTKDRMLSEIANTIEKQ